MWKMKLMGWLSSCWRRRPTIFTIRSNIGNPHELTVLEIAETIIKLTNSRSKIAFEPLPEDDPKVRRPDIGRAKKLLDWSPGIPLEEGLLRTIEYFRSLTKV